MDSQTSSCCWREVSRSWCESSSGRSSTVTPWLADGEAKHVFHRGHNLHAVIAARLALCLFTNLGAQRPSRPVLVWGGDAEGGAPFVEADPADPSQVRGFDVEVAARIARGLGGRTARFVQVQWSNIDQS